MTLDDDSIAPRTGVPARRATIRDGETLVEWPHCPSCGAPRTTSCPACDTEGATWEQAFGPTLAQFDAEDQVQSPSQHRAAVICPTCDEVFRPIFARRCTACKHTFSDFDAPDSHLLSDSALARRSKVQTIRMILAAIALAAVLYTLYDWLMSNTGGARMF